MKTKDLLELAGDPRFISGIYNHCDRWCEHCAFTSRCLLYAQEQADADDPEANDINNQAFWTKLKAIFEQTHEMLNEMARERGIDLDSLDLTEVDSRERELEEKTQSHELSLAGTQYSKMVTEWFDLEYPTIEAALIKCGEEDLPLVDFDFQEKVERVSDAIEVIRWYQIQIAVKIMRGLRRDDDEEDEPDSVRQKDSDGSVKVALIGMDRSIGAWGRLREEFPAHADTILPLLFHLEQLRGATERAFPAARNFIRPGFDDAGGPFVS